MKINKITIIIPMRNEEAFVATCLDSMSVQLEDLPDCEIFCVDGASTDRTREIILEYESRDKRIRLLDNPNKIVPVAMNTAISQACGDVIIRLDCHAAYPSDYLKNCLDILRKTGADNVGGYGKTVPSTDSTIGKAIAAATSSPFGVGGARFRTGGEEQEVDTVPFGCFRRSVFERFGLYDERLTRNQDIELNARIRKGGGRIVISPKIQCTYYNRSTFSGLRQQAFFNGLWNPYTIYLTGGGLRLRHFVPLAFIMSIVFFATGGILWKPFWVFLATELLIYSTIGLVMAVKAAKEKNANFLLIFIAFIQLHLTYGAGSLWGVCSAPFKFGVCRKTDQGEALPDRRN